MKLATAKNLRRLSWRIISCKLTIAFLLLPRCIPAQDPAPVSQQASEYVIYTLDLMQMHSINAQKIDWPTLRKETLEHAAGAETTYDTYDAIRFALQNLNDRHSFLQLSEGLVRQDQESHARRGVPAAKLGGSEKWPPSPYVDRRKPEGEILTIKGSRIARIVVPLLENGDAAHMKSFAETLQTQIEMLAKQNPAGWIIDLRGNLGGNMWPMLTGIAPLIDAREVGGFFDKDGNKTVWFIGADGAGLRKPDGTEELECRVPRRKIVFRKRHVIAVLIDRGTASSGEAVAIALRGQAQTRFFGRATHGQTTANEGFPLPDGANLVLATGIEADRTGELYWSGLIPDVDLSEQSEIPKSWNSDPMIKSAAEWISIIAQNDVTEPEE